MNWSKTWQSWTWSVRESPSPGCTTTTKSGGMRWRPKQTNTLECWSYQRVCEQSSDNFLKQKVHATCIYALFLEAPIFPFSLVQHFGANRSSFQPSLLAKRSSMMSAASLPDSVALDTSIDRVSTFTFLFSLLFSLFYPRHLHRKGEHFHFSLFTFAFPFLPLILPVAGWALSLFSLHFCFPFFTLDTYMDTVHLTGWAPFTFPFH